MQQCILANSHNKQFPECRKLIHMNIKNEFKNLKTNKITKEHFKKIQKLPKEILSQLGILHVQIINNKVYTDYSGMGELDSPKTVFEYLKHVEDAAQKHGIKNLQMYLHVNDDIIVHHSSTVNQIISSIPMFHFNKLLNKTEYNNIIQLPDPFLFDNWDKLIDKIKKANCKYKWDQKAEKIFWRGSPTGREYSIRRIQYLPRVILVTLSILYPHFIDAKFTGPAYYEKNEFGKKLKEFIEIVNSGCELEHFPEEEHLKYKYLVSIDGNAAAWKRVPWIMLSNSVLFLQHKFVQYFYPAMKPWVHYVPLKDDISDIFDKFCWAKENEKKVQEISSNATFLVEQCLMPQHLEEDLVLILNEYAKMQTFTITKPTLPPLQSDTNIRIFSKH